MAGRRFRLTDKRNTKVKLIATPVGSGGGDLVYCTAHDFLVDTLDHFGAV